MGRRTGLLYLVRRLKVALIAFALTIAVAPVFAAGEWIPASQPIPEGIRVVGTNATGVNASATARMTLGGVTTHSKFPVAVGSATLGGLFRGAMRRVIPGIAWYQLAKSVIDGAGWAINELQQQVVAPGEPAEPLGPQAWCITNASIGINQRRCADAPETLCAVIIASSVYTCEATGYIDANTFRYDGVRKDGQPGLMSASSSLITQPGGGWEPFENANPSVAEGVVSDYELGQLLKQHPQIVNAILIDPETGAPIRTAELIAALNALRRSFEAANGLPPGVDLMPDDLPVEEITPSQTDWPGFCDWATTVCEFIDWVRAEPEEDTPPEDPWAEEPEIPQQDWSSGLGGGSCPGPISFTVSIGTYSQNVEFPYTPLCEGAGWIRPIAIALCGLLGVFIVGGYRRSANA